MPKKLMLFEAHLKFLWMLGINVSERVGNFIWQGFFKILVLIDSFIAVPFKLFRPVFIATETSLSWELVQGITCLLSFLTSHGRFVGALSLKCICLQLVWVFRMVLKEWLSSQIQSFCFISSLGTALFCLLKTYGVYTASALKQVFHVPCSSELLIQTLSQLVS